MLWLEKIHKLCGIAHEHEHNYGFYFPFERM